jgi:hypothetical protein
VVLAPVVFFMLGSAIPLLWSLGELRLRFISRLMGPGCHGYQPDAGEQPAGDRSGDAGLRHRAVALAMLEVSMTAIGQLRLHMVMDCSVSALASAA